MSRGEIPISTRESDTRVRAVFEVFEVFEV